VKALGRIMAMEKSSSKSSYHKKREGQYPPPPYSAEKSSRGQVPILQGENLANKKEE
jgi:hypothetical protein